MSDGPSLRLKRQRALFKADMAQKRIDHAKAEVAVARHKFEAMGASIRLYFARRAKRSALASAERAKLRLMAMVI